MNESTTATNDSKYSPPPRRKRVVPLREELVAVTNGDGLSALILSQFLYWADKGARQDGWIWKSAEELAEVDLFGIASGTTVGRRLSRLVEVEYLECRKNPDRPTDRTKQYRVNVANLIDAVESRGHHLDGWTTTAPPNRQSADSIVQNENSIVQSADSIVQNAQCITESTSRDYKQSSSTSEGSKSESDPRPIEADDHDSPAQKLLAMSQKAGVHLSILQAENAWETLKDKLDDDVWGYIRFKLADLDGTDYPRRRKYEYLIGDADIDRWLELNGESQVGAHTERDVGRHTKTPSRPTTTPATPPDPPGGPTTSAEKDRGDDLWSKAQEFLDSELPPVEREASLYLECVACRDRVIYLWPEIAEAGGTLEGCWDTVRDAVQRVGGHDAVLMQAREG